jgi:hypothetical protein
MVNANSVTETFMNLSKPFMKKELASKVRITQAQKRIFIETDFCGLNSFASEKENKCWSRVYRTLSVSVKCEDILY